MTCHLDDDEAQSSHDCGGPDEAADKGMRFHTSSLRPTEALVSEQASPPVRTLINKERLERNDGESSPT